MQFSRLRVFWHARPLLWRKPITAICSRTEAEWECDDLSGGCTKHSIRPNKITADLKTQLYTHLKFTCILHAHAFHSQIDLHMQFAFISIPNAVCIHIDFHMQFAFTCILHCYALHMLDHALLSVLRPVN